LRVKYKFENYLGIGLSIVSIVLLLLVFCFLDVSFWSDEFFTFHFVLDLPFSLMWHNILIDVHPPLYYFISYMVLNLLNLLNITYNEIIVLKVVSIVPIIILLIFGLTVLRRRFGWLFSGIFSLALISAPRIMHFSTEIRSYSWGILFLTLAFFAAYLISENPNKIKNYLLLSLFSLLSLYTHYGTFFTIFSIYILLFIFLLRNDKSIISIRSIKLWLMSMAISIVGFIVWVPVLLNQIKLGNADWFRFPTINYLYDLFYCLFSASNSFTVVALLSLASFVILTVCCFYKRELKTNFLSYGLILLLISIIVTLLISFVKPVWCYKSFWLMLGVIWLSFAFLLQKMYDDKKVFVPLFIIFCLSCGVNTVTYFGVENDNHISLNEIEHFLGHVDENQSVIVSFAADADTSCLVYSLASPTLRNNVYFVDFRFKFLQLSDLGKYRSGSIQYNVEDAVKHLSGLVNDSFLRGKKIYIFSRKDYNESIGFREYFVSRVSSLKGFYPVLQKDYLSSLFDDEFNGDFVLRKVMTVHRSNEDGGLMGLNEGNEIYIYELLHE
jgi:hypothetical protein